MKGSNNWWHDKYKEIYEEFRATQAEEILEGSHEAEDEVLVYRLIKFPYCRCLGYIHPVS